MAASAFLDVCRFNPTLGGTTDWTYSSAVTGYQSPAAAGVVNGAQYSYRAESSDLSQWEIGTGTYNTGTGVLSRTTVLKSTNSNAKVSFSAAPQVAVVALAEDLTVTMAAAKSDQQSATSATLAVTPAHQQDHDSAAKASVYFTVAGGVVTVQESYNVTSVTRASAGVFNITFTAAFANTFYRGCGTPESNALNMGLSASAPATKTASLYQAVTINSATGTPADPAALGIAFFGRQ